MSYLKSISQRLMLEAEGDEDTKPEDKPEVAKGDVKVSTNTKVSLDSQIDNFFVKLESGRFLQEQADERWMTRQFLEAADDKPGFDPHKFTMGVMRLVNNYDTLLDVQDTIIRRAEKYLRDNKSPEMAKEFMDELDDSFGYKPGESSAMKEFEYEAPPAVRSGGAT